jgi:hypothetical protein
MLRAMMRWLSSAGVGTQLELPLAGAASAPDVQAADAPRRNRARIRPLAFDERPPVRDPDALRAALERHGMRGIDRCSLTRNRSVMVSVRGTELRVHEAFAAAPDGVLRAIATFVSGRGAARRAARQAILSYPIERPARTRSRERLHPDDAPLAAKLAIAHARLNAERFEGTLGEITVRVSRRMRSRLGHYSVATPSGEPAEIVISRRHFRRHGWSETLDTLLHEMVHQWQAETGLPIDHGRRFRDKARQVGATPAARRALGGRRLGPTDRRA